MHKFCLASSLSHNIMTYLQQFMQNVLTQWLFTIRLHIGAFSGTPCCNTVTQKQIHNIIPYCFLSVKLEPTLCFCVLNGIPTFQGRALSLLKNDIFAHKSTSYGFASGLKIINEKICKRDTSDSFPPWRVML